MLQPILATGSRRRSGARSFSGTYTLERGHVGHAIFVNFVTALLIERLGVASIVDSVALERPDGSQLFRGAAVHQGAATEQENILALPASSAAA